MREILHTKDPQGIKRKLNNYGISYTEEGRGSDLCITITNIENPFKVFCIVELGFPASCKFDRLRDFVLYFFCWDEFREFPDEQMELFLRDNDQYVCRQTIRGWMRRFEQNNLILQRSNEYIYYGIYKDERYEITKEEYGSAWSCYFENIRKGASSSLAFMSMTNVYGYIPRKKEVAVINGIYAQIIDTLIDLAQKEVEKEMCSGLLE